MTAAAARDSRSRITASSSRRDDQMSLVAIGGVGHHHVVAGLGVERQRAAAADFDVVRMRADGEDA